ncbi:MAG: hypothetical protein WD690_02690 [Vicinamibacterales bacterium]
MKRVFTAVIVAAAVASASAAEWVVARGPQQAAPRADIEGTWSARVRVPEKADGQRVPQLQLQMMIDDDEGGRNRGNWGQSVPLAAFTSLPSNLDAAQDVKFELRRDAGVVLFQGRFESGRGVGHLFFTANREFERAMEQQTRDTVTDRELLSFALMDVSRAFVTELQSLGYTNLREDELVDWAIHGRRLLKTRRGRL